jgi:hypothetical protein
MRRSRKHARRAYDKSLTVFWVGARPKAPVRLHLRKHAEFVESVALMNLDRVRGQGRQDNGYGQPSQSARYYFVSPSISALNLEATGLRLSARFREVAFMDLRVAHCGDNQH